MNEREAHTILNLVGVPRGPLPWRIAELDRERAELRRRIERHDAHMREWRGLGLDRTAVTALTVTMPLT